MVTPSAPSVEGAGIALAMTEGEKLVLQNRSTWFNPAMRVISLSVKACGFATFLIRGRQEATK